MLVVVDETLWECLLMNADPDSKDAKEFAFAPDHVARYRQEVLTRPEQDGQAVLHRLLRQRKEEAQEDGVDWEDAVLGKLAGGEENNCYLSYWDADTERTVPLILAKIPVKNPWEIFAWLPFGGWNECPDTPELMAIANYWYQRYGAVPAVMTHDQLEFTLPTPAPRARAMELVQEQYGFCPDVVDQDAGEATVGRLADTLWRSDKWYFWWD